MNKKRIKAADNSTLKPLLALDYAMKIVNKKKHSASSANPFSEASNGSSLRNVSGYSAFP
jgi:hypothetical protein